MSNETSKELVVNPAPHINAPMTKNRLMQFTFFAILAVLIVSAAIWSQVTTTSGWNLGATIAASALISVGLAVLIDFLIGKTAADSEVNTWSAAVFGLIVTACFTFGVPAMNTEMGLPVEGPMALIYVAVMTLIGIVFFKKVMSLAGRKLVNPAATAKFLVLLPAAMTTLLAVDHLSTGPLGVPALAGPIGNGATAIGTNGAASFGTYLQGCYANPANMAAGLPSLNDIASLMILDKYHGWAGGACSVAVIVAGIALFVLARKYIKWKITVSYLVAIAILSVIFSFAFGDSDLFTRLLFEVFIGSSIFMAFFMATDPATTPFSSIGQIVFGVGLAILTILIQTYMNFFGGALLALIIMNLTVPLIDRFTVRKPFGR
ncbi:MAG: RnfABCDGE type electron transport complex subunit D [Candidatus Bathyarchaeota archaeon]|nr:RnfABCDGE type electron transport complex subunit D [Candidatus Bathyarchaeota archaeon]